MARDKDTNWDVNCDDGDCDKGEVMGDAALWDAITHDVQPLRGRDLVAPRKNVEAKPKSPRVSKPVKQRQPRIDATAKPCVPMIEPRSREIDRATRDALRKGQVPIEGRLDLHGMNQGQARQALHGAIMAAYHSGRRCLLVITGKGITGRTSDTMGDYTPGVLKQNVPAWLYEAPIDDLVLTSQAAIPKHGGGGALYVYLRRKRD